MSRWKATEGDRVLASSTESAGSAKVALFRNFEFRVPLQWLMAAPLEIDKVREPEDPSVLTTRLRLRFSLWRNHLPVDALPMEGWIGMELLTEGDLLALAF
jgi:hypothetical protein